MTRLVELEANGPRKLQPEDVDDEKGDIAVCQCGLSESFPFCDGSHRRTEDEREGTTYVYENGDRREVDRIVTSDEVEERNEAESKREDGDEGEDE